MLLPALALLAVGTTPVTASVEIHASATQAIYEKNGIEVRMLVEDGDSYIGTLRFGAGTKVAPHRHETSEELLTILEGEGTMTIGGKPVVVKAGDAVHIPKNIEHDFLAGSAPVRAIQVYTPRGPEERFRSWPLRKP